MEKFPANIQDGDIVTWKGQKYIVRQDSINKTWACEGCQIPKPCGQPCCDGGRVGVAYANDLYARCHFVACTDETLPKKSAKKRKATKKWRTIPYNQLRMQFQCDDCKAKINIDIDRFNDAGSPCCSNPNGSADYARFIGYQVKI